MTDPRHCNWYRPSYEHEWREDVVSESGRVCIYCGMRMPEYWPDDDDEGVAEMWS